MDFYTDTNGQCGGYGNGQVSVCPSVQNSCSICPPPDYPDIIQYPVAMAYVPWQQWQPTYAPERGLAQGTIFPDLDLQFNCGRCGR